MNCTRPFIKEGRAHGCGQCLACRINNKRIWTHRLVLEAGEYEHNAFITLTYTDDQLPKGNTLDPVHSRNFLKRLRKSLEPTRFRYYLVGEYGDITQRPHYHAILFNYPSCEWGGTRHTRTSCCVPCDRIRQCWGKGRISVDEFNPDTAAYVAGYVTKKLDGSHPDLKGRYPEFSRMSRNPGIGYSSVHDFADRLLQSDAFLRGGNDVPSSVRHGSRSWPLGRYLKKKLRKAVGRSEDAPQATLDKMAEALLPVRSYAFENSLSFKDTLLATFQGSRTNLVARHRIHKSRKHL